MKKGNSLFHPKEGLARLSVHEGNFPGMLISFFPPAARRYQISSNCCPVLTSGPSPQQFISSKRRLALRSGPSLQQFISSKRRLARHSSMKVISTTLISLFLPFTSNKFKLLSGT